MRGYWHLHRVHLFDRSAVRGREHGPSHYLCSGPSFADSHGCNQEYRRCNLSADVQFRDGSLIFKCLADTILQVTPRLLDHGNSECDDDKQSDDIRVRAVSNPPLWNLLVDTALRRTD